MRKKIAAILAALTLAGAGTALITQPAQAVVSGSFRICNSSNSYTNIYVIDTDHRYWWDIINLQNNGQCTEWLSPAGIRVNTDPYGPSHSYRIKPLGPGASNVYGPCHTNSDNHDSDPPNPSSGDTWSVYYWNFDGGNCAGTG